MTSVDECNIKLHNIIIKSATLIFRCRNVISNYKITQQCSSLQVFTSCCHFKTKYTHPVSFSAIPVHLRHNRLCLPEYLPKRVFKHNFVWMFPFKEKWKRNHSVWIAPLSLSLSLSLSLCVCSLQVCAAAGKNCVCFLLLALLLNKNMHCVNENFGENLSK